MLFSDQTMNYSLPKFRLVDHVLVARKKNTFEKGYTATVPYNVCYLSVTCFLMLYVCMYVSWRGIRNSSCPFLMGWPSSISHAAQAQLNLIHCRLSAGCAYSRSVYTFQRPGHHAFYRTFLHARSPRLSLSGKGKPESQFHAPCRDKTLSVNSRGI